MSTGQWRVLVLLLVLLALEIIRSAGTKSFFTDIISSLKASTK